MWGLQRRLWGIYDIISQYIAMKFIYFTCKNEKYIAIYRNDIYMLHENEKFALPTSPIDIISMGLLRAPHLAVP